MRRSVEGRPQGDRRRDHFLRVRTRPHDAPRGRVRPRGEGPDAIARRLLDEDVKPEFALGDYAAESWLSPAASITSSGATRCPRSNRGDRAAACCPARAGRGDAPREDAGRRRPEVPGRRTRRMVRRRILRGRVLRRRGSLAEAARLAAGVRPVRGSKTGHRGQGAGHRKRRGQELRSSRCRR